MIATEKGIQFSCDWHEAAPPIAHDVVYWRNKLYEIGLIGAYPDGVGYGNLSVRRGNGFVITGSRTGKIEKIEAHHLSLVTECLIDNHKLVCQGPVVASSESISHAAIYESDPDVGAVIHVHSDLLWRRMLATAIRTEPFAGAGTQEMTGEIRRLFHEKNFAKSGIFVMAGHPDGIMAFGTTMDEAGNLLLETCINKGLT